MRQRATRLNVLLPLHCNDQVSVRHQPMDVRAKKDTRVHTVSARYAAPTQCEHMWRSSLLSSSGQQLGCRSAHILHCVEHAVRTALGRGCAESHWARLVSKTAYQPGQVSGAYRLIDSDGFSSEVDRQTYRRTCLYMQKQASARTSPTRSSRFWISARRLRRLPILLVCCPRLGGCLIRLCPPHARLMLFNRKMRDVLAVSGVAHAAHEGSCCREYDWVSALHCPATFWYVPGTQEWRRNASLTRGGAE